MRGPQAGRCQGSPVLAKDEPVCTPCPLAENHGDATATGSILLQIGTASLGLRGKEMKRSTLGSGGQRSRSHDAEVRFGDTWRRHRCRPVRPSRFF